MASEAGMEGYQFAGWYIDEACTKRLNPGGILPRVITIYDKWVPVWYPILYDVQGGVNDPANPHLISIESSPIDLHPASKEGKYFDGWYWNGRKIDRLPTGIHEPLHLQARFREAWRIHFNTAGGARLESISAGPGNMLPPLPVPRRMGFTFSGWFMDPDCRNRVPENGRLTRDATLYAGWEPEVYTIEYDTQGGLNSRRNPRTYTHFDRDILLLPARKKGCRFVGWFDPRGNEVTSIPSRSIGTYKLTARFEPER